MRAARAAGLVAAASLLLGACTDGDDPEEPDDGTDVEAPDDGPDDGAAGDDEVTGGPDPDEPDDPDLDDPGADGADDDPTGDDGVPDDGTDGETPDDGAADDEPEDAAPPLEGDPSTETVSDDGEFGPDLVVTDVRVAGHDGFDRLVLELEGDGLAGWFVGYAEEATAQGSGHPIELAGDAVLEVSASNVTLPPELPEGVEPWSDDPVAGPDDGVIVEVVDDSIYEGMHRLVVGTTGEQPFLVDRLDDPQRIVIDVLHG